MRENENENVTQEKIIIIKQEEIKKKNVPKAIIIHDNDSFQDVYSKAVVDIINIMLQPI